jgi:hypothetical protein
MINLRKCYVNKLVLYVAPFELLKEGTAGLNSFIVCAELALFAALNSNTKYKHC